MPQKPDFKELQKHWYKKLKDSGFEDVEKDEYFLIRDARSKRIFRSDRSIEYYESVIEYYQLAENFLHDFKFKTEREKIIWEYHANGISMRDIVIIMQKAGIKDLTRTKVCTIIGQLRKEMKNLYQIYGRKTDA